MAHPMVEKLKAVGIRHGEKAAIALAATTFVLLVALAVMKPTIPLTPDEVSKAAESANSNLARRQDPEQIQEKLKEENITLPGFEKMVDAAAGAQINPDLYRVEKLWVSTEPGAGLIRDTPILIAPTELIAHAGRGGALIYELDEKGNRIPIDQNDPAERKEPRPGRVRRRQGAGGAGGGMMAGMGGGAMTQKQIDEAKQRRKDEEAKIARVLAGEVDPEAEKAKAKEKEALAGGAPAEIEPPAKEQTRGLRWVSLTAVLDNKKLKSNYLAALKDPALAYPNYKRVDSERQALQPDGTWSEWQAVDMDKNLLVIDNLPEVDEEWVPDDARMEALVDPLPFLNAGYWEKVHVARLVPKEKRELPKEQNVGMGMGGMMGGMMGMRGMAGMRGGMAMGGGDGGEMGGMPGGGMASMRGGMAMGGMGMGGMMGGMGMGGGGDYTAFQKSEQPEIMVRSLDFTVDPDKSYRFRIRIVVNNPNFKHEDVTPGVDTQSEELLGPWSEPSDEVHVPADVVSFATTKVKAGLRPDRVIYEVVRWNPEDGQTVISNFEAGPGEVIGDYRAAAVPDHEGKGAQSKPIDFTSHMLVLDSLGGQQPIPQIGTPPGMMNVPSTSLVVMSDGSVILRNQAIDEPDPVREEMTRNYRRAINDSKKKRQPGGMGMMGGPGGMR